MPISSKLKPALVPILLVLLTGIGVARIVSTYHVFNQTADEPEAIATGVEWLQRGTYTLDNSHPPLARVAAGLGPFLSGLRLQGHGTTVSSGNELFNFHGQYLHNLALARLGILPFFVLAVGVVWVWSLKIFNPTSGLLAVLLFTTLPPVLAHAGLATNDMAVTATLSAALLSLIFWLERPTYGRSFWLGLFVALAFLSKFSTLLLLPACGVAILASRWMLRTQSIEQPRIVSRRHAGAIGLVIVTVCLVIWGGYRFSVRGARPNTSDAVTIENPGSKDMLRKIGRSVEAKVPIPAPDLFWGIYYQWRHNHEGHPSYLLGEVRETGWWYFFPVALAVKTPLPLLILSGIGAFFLIRRLVLRLQDLDWRKLTPLAATAAVLLVAVFSRIDLGVRLVLPIYPLLAIIAGFGAASLCTLPRFKTFGLAAVTVLLLWQIVSSARIHPDYLAYFNELGGSQPDHILVDSDVDWGQDVLRLVDTLHLRKIDSVSIAYLGTADLRQFDLPKYQVLPPYHPTTGWVAISDVLFRTGERQPPYKGYAWLEAYEPVAVAGKSIRLYHIVQP
jgi:hypothetical protein